MVQSSCYAAAGTDSCDAGAPQPLPQVPGQNHRDPWFADFYKKCLHDLKLIFGTKDGTTIIFPGGWASPSSPVAALSSCLRTRRRVVPCRPDMTGG